MLYAETEGGGGWGSGGLGWGREIGYLVGHSEGVEGHCIGPVADGVEP